MNKIKVLWMNNGEQCYSIYFEEAKKFGIDIEPCYSVKECRVKLNANICKWKAVILNIDCRMESEKPKASNIGLAIKKLRRDYPNILRFVAVNKDNLTYNDRTRLTVLDDNEEYFLLKPSASSLFEAINARIANNPAAMVKKKYARILSFFPEEKLIKLLMKLEYSDISKDTAIPNECRKLLERLKSYPLFENMFIPDKIYNYILKKHEKDDKFNADNYGELSLNDFSYALGLADNIPIHVKRSVFACTSVNQPGSHDSNIDKMIEQGKAPYATKALIIELLNILDWCAILNKEYYSLQTN